MITVEEVVVDPDMTAPEPFTIVRSTGQWLLGGWISNTVRIQQIGPVQQASNKEISMLPEADRVGAVRSFWSTVPILLVRGYAPVPSTHGETPNVATPGLVYNFSEPSPDDLANVYVNGLLQRPNVDYLLVGGVLTFFSSIGSTTTPYVTWPITAQVGAAESDILEYGSEQYRVLSVYRVPGSGYWKALGTRLAAA